MKRLNVTLIMTYILHVLLYNVKCLDCLLWSIVGETPALLMTIHIAHHPKSESISQETFSEMAESTPNGTSPIVKPVQLSVTLPYAPDTRIRLHLTTQKASLLLFLTTTSAEAGSSAAPLGSFVYAIPSVCVFFCYLNVSSDQTMFAVCNLLHLAFLFFLSFCITFICWKVT